jgi:hypothetical protein
LADICNYFISARDIWAQEHSSTPTKTQQKRKTKLKCMVINGNSIKGCDRVVEFKQLVNIITQTSHWNVNQS